MYHRFVEQKRNPTPASVKANIVVPLTEDSFEVFGKHAHLVALTFALQNE